MRKKENAANKPESDFVFIENPILVSDYAKIRRNVRKSHRSYSQEVCFLVSQGVKHLALSRKIEVSNDFFI